MRAHATSRDGGSSGSKPAAIDEAAPSDRQDPKEEEVVEPASALDSDGGQGKRKSRMKLPSKTAKVPKLKENT